MTKRTMLVSMLAGAAAAGVNTARADDMNERARFLYQDLIQLVGEGRAEVSDKIRLALLYRQAGANAEASKLLAEAAAEYPDLNTLLNPNEVPEYQEMLTRARVNGDAAVGPDVIVGDLNGIGVYTSTSTVGGMMAFSVGTTSCNLGTVPLEWIELSSRHPVIAQNFYRLNNGRFEHIGMGWLKHGFCALQENICGACTPYGNCCCDHLGLLCSDPYTASLNGSQGRLGPRNQVNAATAVYPWPFYQRNVTGNAIYKRVQVRATDMNPALNAGASYFAEAQYVAFDDATAGNKNNNASYRRINPSWSTGGGTVSSVAFGGSTQRQKPAIQAWQDNDPTVTLVNVDVPGDGRMIVGYKVTDLGGGQWSYEYAIQNLNSDRAAMSFSVPTTGASVSSIGFHDVDYHDGDGTPVGTTQDGTDWAAVADASAVSWSTAAEASNPNANALKWGTLYNYRFVANQAPAAATATIGLFKNGGSVTAAVQGPACLLAGDINGDNVVNFADLNLVLANFGTTYTFQDLNNVLANFGLSC